jgi:hypothetical protein
LREVFQLADVDFTDQRRNILVVLITGSAVMADLPKIDGQILHHAEFGDVATKLMQAASRRAYDGAEVATRDAYSLSNLRIFLIERAQRMVVHRAALAVGAQT